MSEESLSPRKVPETLLKTVLSNLDGAKRDLDKHWMYLIIATAVSLAITSDLGILVYTRILGEAAARVVSESEHRKLLFLLVPLVNFYLFMRFGFLLAYFTGVRLAAEDLADQYFQEEKLASESLSSHLLFGTNSFFEYVHERERKFGLLLYALAILSVLALNHAASLHLLWLHFNGYYKYVSVASYFLALAVLCYHYYDVNSARRINVIGNRTIAISVIVDLGLTVILFLCFIR